MIKFAKLYFKIIDWWKLSKIAETNSSPTVPKIVDKSVPEETVAEKTQNKTDACINVMKRKCQDHKKEEEEEEEPRDVKVKKVATTLKIDPTKDNVERLRKTILWLEQGGRKLREELAAVRTELHEERRAAKLTKRELDNAIKQAKQLEAAKYQHIIAEIKSRWTLFINFSLNIFYIIHIFVNSKNLFSIVFVFLSIR